MEVFDSKGLQVFTAITQAHFSDEEGGTRLDVVQTYTVHDKLALPMITGASQGWSETLDRLVVETERLEREATSPRSVSHATFRIERVYPVPLAKVWDALTQSEAKSQWFGGPPGKFELLERHMDVRAGGRERLKGRWQDGTVTTFDARYFDVVTHERLVYVYDMLRNERKLSVSLATVEFTEIDGKTRLTVTEQGAFLDGYDDAGSREEGTGHLLDALGTSLCGSAGYVSRGTLRDSDPSRPH
jgi:uncharacterized protein YndB with AHSA1/START domain